MATPTLARSQVLKTLTEYFLKDTKKRLKQCVITGQKAACGTIYRTWPEDTPVWYVYFPDNGPVMRTGPCRIIVISKIAGTILFDGYIGE